MIAQEQRQKILSPAAALLLSALAAGHAWGQSAYNDSASAEFETLIEIDVLYDDYPWPNSFDYSSITIVDSPENGTATVDPFICQIVYTPDDGFDGVDTLTYKYQDDQGNWSNTATVTITVNPDPIPLAQDDFAYGNYAESVQISMLDNDDPWPHGYGVNTATIVSGPEFGTAQFDVFSNDIVYTPDYGFYGLDSLTYTYEDDSGTTSNVATIFISIEEPVPPFADDDAAQTMVGEAAWIDVLQNDYDFYSGLDPYTVTIVSGPENGTAEVDYYMGAITYTPAAGFAGVDTLQYCVYDYEGLESNVATVEILVVNNAPYLTLSVYRGYYDAWILEGQVSDDEDVTGLVVTFDGLIEAQTLVNSSGSFSYSEVNSGSGIVFAKTVDQHGAESNEATEYINP